MRTSALAILPILSLARAALAQGIDWSPSVEQGLQDARNRNAPVLVSFIQDGEEANDRMVNGIHKAAEVVKLTRRFVCFIANHGTHEQVGQKQPDGNVKQVCQKFGTVSCVEHRAIEAWAFKQYTQGEVKTPQHLFCDPTGKVLETIIDVPDVSGFTEALENTLRAAGPGLSNEEYRKFSDSLAAAESAAKLGRYSEAIKGFKAVLAAKNAQKAALADRAKEGIKQVEESGKKSLVAADEATANKDWVPAVVELERLAREFKGEALARTAGEKLRVLKANAEVNADLKAKAAEVKAYAVLDEAEKQLAKGKPADGVRLLTQVSTGFADRPVGKRAAALLATLEADPKTRDQVVELKVKRDCETWLKMADEAVKAGDNKRAAEFLKRIVVNAPGTSFAQEADARLKALPDGEKK
jgi:tetratricopeptide (TPR) repeat protein